MSCQLCDGTEETTNADDAAVDEIIDEPKYDFERKKVEYEIAMLDEFADANIAGPPVLTIAKHICSNQEDDEALEQTVDKLYDDISDILLLGASEMFTEMFFKGNLKKDFVVCEGHLQERLRALAHPRIINFGASPHLRGDQSCDQFMGYLDLNIRQDISDEDVADLKDRIEELNVCTGRNDIEDDWKEMGVSEREKRQYRLSYNFFLVLLLFTDSLQSSSRYQ